ncbi:hypothetical protein GOP47_0026698, partial [Adiantum capillus-veneris]
PVPVRRCVCSPSGSCTRASEAWRLWRLLHSQTAWRRRDMLHNLKGRSDEEMLKGQAVRSQKACWDKALGVRILLQKPFSNANRLPLGDVKMGMSQSSREVEGAFVKLNATTTKTLLSLHQTLKVLLNQVDSMSRVSDNNSASKDD